MRCTIKMNSPMQWTPDAESELLFRCCAVFGPFADSQAIFALVERGVDWNRFLVLANHNALTPMVAARLGAEGVANLPSHVARMLRLSYQVNALRCNHLAGCAVEIVESAAAGITAIAIKGPALAIARTAKSRCACSATWISLCGGRRTSMTKSLDGGLLHISKATALRERSFHLMPRCARNTRRSSSVPFTAIPSANESGTRRWRNALPISLPRPNRPLRA